jgi:outer membrane immunogenic protein
MSAASYAADLPAKVPPPQPLAPVWDWSGFYLGGNVGYGVGHDSTIRSLAGTPQDSPFELAPAGGLGGGQIGYNSQFGKWLLGIEADWQWAHQTDSACSNQCTPFAALGGLAAWNFAPSINSLATIRGRVGFAQNRSLWYLTAGGAWGRVDDNFSFNNGVFATTTPGPAHDKFGWAAGGGVETALAGAWSAKLEYLYVDLGSVTDALSTSGLTGVATSTIHDHIVRLGLNYRFAPGFGHDSTSDADGGVTPLTYKAPTAHYNAAPATTRMIYNWTGFYVGANIGYGVGRDPTKTLQDQPALGEFLLASFSVAPTGISAGPQIGANWQTGNLVVGFEADWQRSSQEDYACLNSCDNLFSVTYDRSLEWFGTARARIGYAQDKSLWYVTGGGAWGRVDDKFSLFSTFFNVFPAVSASHDLSGWTAGGGVETALTGPWTAKLEYLYMDLGKVTDSYSTTLFGGTIFPTSSFVRNNVVRAGLNYRFGDPSAGDMPPDSTIFYKAPPTHCIWCDWYVGANAGDAFSRNTFSNVATPIPDALLGLPAGVTEGLAALTTGSVPIGSTNSFVGGAQAGYNWQFGNFVPGFEADIEGFSRSGSSRTVTNTTVVVGVPTTTTQTAAMSTSYLGTLRGRLGLLVTPTWLSYVTGGLAFGGVKTSDTLFQTGTNGFIGGGSASLIEGHAGWALGAGVEWMFAPRWSTKIEYLHYDLGTANLNWLPFTGTGGGNVYQSNVLSARFSGDIVRVGINYHFGS